MLEDAEDEEAEDADEEDACAVVWLARADVCCALATLVVAAAVDAWAEVRVTAAEAV